MILVVIMIYVSGKVPVCVISQQSDSHILHPQINSLSTSRKINSLAGRLDLDCVKIFSG